MVNPSKSNNDDKGQPSNKKEVGLSTPSKKSDNKFQRKYNRGDSYSGDYNSGYSGGYSYSYSLSLSTNDLCKY